MTSASFRSPAKGNLAIDSRLRNQNWHIADRLRFTYILYSLANMSGGVRPPYGQWMKLLLTELNT